jgi:Tfp pilus assembly protein PilE
MKRMVVVGLLLLLAVPSFAAETMTDAERAALVAHLERTAARFEKSLGGVSAGQWSFKAAPERWSVAEAAEHIIASESFIRGAIEKAMTGEATDVPAAARKDAVLDKLITDRSKKFQAPEPLKPAGKYASPAEALAAFRAERQKTIEFVKNGGDFRTHAAEHPAVGLMDGYSWVVFLSGHSERHTLQIEEVQADAGYPKG